MAQSADRLHRVHHRARRVQHPVPDTIDPLALVNVALAFQRRFDWQNTSNPSQS
ncbi:MAG: hypothetical protein U5K28_02725 [Halobacteriales archaeon]|nr:hypothetical protein [Halobacteriales archaeon]